MTYVNNVVDFEPPSSIQELSIEDIEVVAGGPLPVLGLAVLATTVQFSFIRGVFSGVRKKAERQANQ